MTVLKIYELISLGYVIKKVERYLADDEDLCSLSAKTIKRIATDRRYLGEFEYKGVMYYNITPQMIDQKLFDLVQTGVKKRLKHQDNTKYYFGNKVMAGNEILIHEMTKKKNRNYYYYRSTTTRKRINQDILLDQTLYKLLVHANIVDREDLIQNKTKKIKVTDLKIKRLYDKYRLSKLNEKDYIIALTRLEMEKAPLLNEVKILYKKDYSKWYSYNDEERTAFINACVKRVHVDLDLNFVIDIEYK